MMRIGAAADVYLYKFSVFKEFFHKSIPFRNFIAYYSISTCMSFADSVFGRIAT